MLWLGLPSTTAIVLILCGCERGNAAATEMAESSLLGLAAAVTLPLAYAQAVRVGWRLPAALAAAVTGYLVVAATLGSMPAPGALPRLGIALFADPLCAAAGHDAYRSRSESVPAAALASSRRWACARPYRRSMSWSSAIVERMAGPGWAGLVSTFPSMSLVVLAVTHLEAGPAEASRIAKVLAAGQLEHPGLPGGVSLDEHADRPRRRDPCRLRGGAWPAALFIDAPTDDAIRLGFATVTARPQEIWLSARIVGPVIVWPAPGTNAVDRSFALDRALRARAPRHLVRTRTTCGHRGRFVAADRDRWRGEMDTSVDPPHVTFSTVSRKRVDHKPQR